MEEREAGGRQAQATEVRWAWRREFQFRSPGQRSARFPVLFFKETKAYVCFSKDIVIDF